MLTNLGRYKKDLDSLLAKGDDLQFAIQYEYNRQDFVQAVKKQMGDKSAEFLKSLPSFAGTYQMWYSEAKVLIRQLLPERLEDFARHYEKPKSRKQITSENYSIEDCLQGLTVSRGDHQKIAGPDAAIPLFRQQLGILRSAKGRFESSLFNIQQLVQADVFDSELSAAQELVKHKFTRAAGALAGVVLERHLAQVCSAHKVKVAKNSPTIAELNNALKEASVIDIPQWRFVQHLADIRNLCSHNKESEPSAEQVNDMVSGVGKVTKTIL